MSKKREFVVLINVDNAAFKDNPYELSGALMSVVRKLDQGERSGNIKDSNGNQVGGFYFRESWR